MYLATVFSSSNCFKNAKYLTNGWAFAFDFAYEICVIQYRQLIVKVNAVARRFVGNPFKSHMKSRCQNVLRNSPSVMS